MFTVELIYEEEGKKRRTIIFGYLFFITIHVGVAAQGNINLVIDNSSRPWPCNKLLAFDRDDSHVLTPSPPIFLDAAILIFFRSRIDPLNETKSRSMKYKINLKTKIITSKGTILICIRRISRE